MGAAHSSKKSTKKQSKTAKIAGKAKKPALEATKAVVDQAFAFLQCGDHSARAEVLSAQVNVLRYFTDILEFRLSGSRSSRFVVTSGLQAVTFDDLSDCQVVLAACAQSLFARNCKRCRFAVASRQTRTRDLRECSIYAWSATGVVFEQCENVRLSSFMVGVGDDEQEIAALRGAVQQHVRAANLMQQKAFEVYNFTPSYSRVFVDEIAHLTAKSAEWEFPPFACREQTAKPNYANFGIPCIFRPTGVRKTLVNCDEYAYETLGTQICSLQTGIRCIRCVHNGNDFLTIQKRVFPHYCMLESQSDIEEALNKLQLQQHALVCDDEDLQTLSRSLK